MNKIFKNIECSFVSSSSDDIEVRLENLLVLEYIMTNFLPDIQIHCKSSTSSNKNLAFFGSALKEFLYPESTVWPCLTSKNQTQKVYSSKTFRKFSLRDFQLFDIDFDNLFDQIKSFDHERVFFKYLRDKVLPNCFLDKIYIDNKENIYGLLDELGWDGYELAHYEGYKKMVFVSQAINMNSEYRIIVVDHQPVSGAACIDSFTPLNNQERQRFHNQVHIGTRFAGQVDVDNKKVEKYVDIAKQITDDFSKEIPEMKHYILDLFTNHKGEIGIVEVNPMFNFGTYANHPDNYIPEIINFLRKTYE